MSRPQIGQQALVRDIYRAAERAGMTNDASVYNRAINAFRPYLDPKVRESQSVGIYLRDQLTSYRGDSQAVKMLQEAYRFIQEPLVNDVYAVARDFVENKPDIPVLFGNIAMVTSQIPPPAGVVLTAVASTISIVAELFGRGQPPPPPPTPEDLINQEFVLDMVGNHIRFSSGTMTDYGRWIWTNEKRTNEFVPGLGASGNYRGKAYAYAWLKELMRTNFFGQANPPQRALGDSGEYGMTIGNHAKDIDQLALEGKARGEQQDRYLWWLMWMCAIMGPWARGRMIGNNDDEKYKRTAFFSAISHEHLMLKRYLETQTYYQKVVDVMAFLTGKMQAFFVDANGKDIENLNPTGETFDFSGKSPNQIMSLYLQANAQRRTQIENRRRQMAGEGRVGQFFISRPLIEASGAVYDLTNDDRKLILKALRYGVLDVPDSIGGGQTGVQIPAFDGDANKRGILYDYLLRFAYLGLPCYIEGVGVPVTGASQTYYLPNLYTFKGRYAVHVYNPNGFNQWSSKIKQDFRQALDGIRSDNRLFKRCLFRKAILQHDEIKRGVYVRDHLNDINVSDLKAEFPDAGSIRVAVNEMRQDGVPLDDRRIIQTWYYFVGSMPAGLTEEELKRLNGLLEDSPRNDAGGVHSFAKTAAIVAAGAFAAKKAGAI